MSTVESFIPKPPKADEKRHFSDKLPPSLIKIYTGLCNSPAKLGLIILGLLIVSISFLGSIEYNSITDRQTMIFAGLAAFGISLLVHKELTTRSRDFFLLTPLSGRSIVWGHWLAVILPLCCVGVMVFIIDLITASLGAFMQEPEVRDLITLDDALTTNLNSTYLLSFICFTSFIVSVAHAIVSGSKLNSFVSLAFLLGVFTYTTNYSMLGSDSIYMMFSKEPTFLFTQREAWIGYALGNALLLGASALMLTMAQRHYEPHATWRPWVMRLLSLIPLAIITSIQLMEGLTPILLQPLWKLGMWITLIIATVDCLYFAPRAGVREIFSSRLWLGAIFLATSFLPRELFPIAPEMYDSAANDLLTGFTTLILVPLLVISLIFGANSQKAGNYLFLGMLLLVFFINFLDELLLDETSILLYAIIVLLLYIASSVWNGFRVSFNKDSSSSASAGMNPISKLSDLLPADLVKSLRQYVKSPVNIIFLVLMPCLLYFTPNDQKIIKFLAPLFWIFACVGISFVIGTHNKKDLSEKGNNFFILTTQSPIRIVLNQWLSGMIMVMILSAILFPAWLDGVDQSVGYIIYLLSIAAVLLSLMLLLQAWGVIFRLGIACIFAISFYTVSDTETPIPIFFTTLAVLMTGCFLLMARRFYESSDRHNMLPVRLICVVIMLLPAIIGNDEHTKIFFSWLGFEYPVIVSYTSVLSILLLDCLLKRDPRHYRWSGIREYVHGQGTFSNILTMIILLIVGSAAIGIHSGIIAAYTCAIMLSYYLTIYVVSALFIVELSTTPYSARRALTFVLSAIGISVLINAFIITSYRFDLGYDFTPSNTLTQHSYALDPAYHDSAFFEPFALHAHLFLGSLFLVAALIVSYRGQRYYRVKKISEAQ